MIIAIEAKSPPHFPHDSHSLSHFLALLNTFVADRSHGLAAFLLPFPDIHYEQYIMIVVSGSMHRPYLFYSAY